MTAAALALALLPLAAAGAAAAPARKAAAPTFEGLARRAADARAAGRLEEAAGHYGQALALKPGWVEGHWALGTILYDLDRHQAAREHFRRVAAARPRDGVALALTALCDARLGAYDAALAGLQKARALGVANAEVRKVAAFHIALLLNRAGDPDAALLILRGLAVQGNDAPSVIEAFGLATLRLRAMPEEVPPEKRDMVVLAGRGGYHMARGRRTAVGRLALEELVSRFPGEPNVHYALGSYLAPDEPDLALAELRQEVARDAAHYPALVQIASIETRRGNAAEALAPAEEAARLAPDVPAAHLVLGRALLELGQAERAVRELERGAALAPESPDIQFSLSRAYQRAGRGADAERARKEFLRLDRARQRDGGAREAEASPGGPGNGGR